jgi:hypothetical protein
MISSSKQRKLTAPSVVLKALYFLKINKKMAEGGASG